MKMSDDEDDELGKIACGNPTGRMTNSRVTTGFNIHFRRCMILSPLPVASISLRISLIIRIIIYLSIIYNLDEANFVPPTKLHSFPPVKSFPFIQSPKE
jgi:hypothetical protein